MGVAQQEAAFPNRKLVDHGCDPTMLAGATDVAVIPSQVVLVHCVARNFAVKAGARPRFGIRQIFRPGPRRLEGEPVGILVDQLSLHRLIGAEGAGATAPDVIPEWKRCRTAWKRLIQIGAPG